MELSEPIGAGGVAGGHWPDTARAACTHFVRNASADPISIGVRLLADLRALFERHHAERLPTSLLLSALNELDDAPWADLDGGRPLDPRRLARMLARYGVKPGTYRFEHDQAKGYALSGEHGLADPVARWLPAPAPSESRTSRTSGNTAGQEGSDASPIGDAGTETSVPATDAVTDVSVPVTASVTPDKPLTSGVTDGTAGTAPQGYGEGDRDGGAR